MTAGRSLVVCDDEPDLRDYVRTVAEELGFEVHDVADSRDCVAEIMRILPDVVVLDILMPGVDGIEVVQGIAAAGYGGRVVLISGYDPRYCRTAAVLAGIKGMTVTSLRKPVGLRELEAALT